MNRTAIYPGTFDPITNGHTELVHRACRMFDRVVLAIAHNREKSPLFDLEERIRMGREVLGDTEGVEVMGFSGLLIDCAREVNAQVVIRGLRAVSDFEYEFQLASMNRKLDSGIETVFLTPSEHYTFVSASLVKEVARYGGDVSTFVHSLVHAALTEKYR